MPLYEYQCRKCRHRFEELQRLSDRPIRRCPKCRTGRVDKLISAPAVQFKGTGWYVTDYAGKAKADRRAGDEKREKGEPAEAAGKADKADKAGKPDKPGKPDTSDKGGREPKAAPVKKPSRKD